MAKKFYAVKEGRIPGIYLSWEDCKVQVNGYSGAVYKSFSSESEARSFMENHADTADMNTCPESDPGTVLAYVDGSYGSSSDEFSYGMVILDHGREYKFSEKIVDKELAAMNNVAGEIKGAEAAMKYALEKGFQKLIIYHDYEGIARWCLGEWKTNRKGTRDYKAFYDSIKDRLQVHFVKVAGHSGDKYNDMADELAKQALGIA
ncbi:MAG: reverse transcriptase-like protein [Lachnospiraceae bacterium]|nr:reverse transcriptase-like protein [Lachnospiraceae bacterium]